jgi:pyruvoyl-dependent arginine decarboxylase (PvlArgDC)
VLILGNHVPYEYFITKGKGETDSGSKFLPYETGSYDAALYEAQEELFMNSHIKCAF